MPLISKIIKKVVHYQHRFRTDHLANLCLSFLTDKILKGGLISIDLQKAFGTINHEILLKKLEAIHFSDQCI